MKNTSARTRVRYCCLSATFFLFFHSVTQAQNLGQLFYSLIDQGQCTTPAPGGCPTFTNACSTGWFPADGTPELIPTTSGWSCAVPCTQGSANCDPADLDNILMVSQGGGITGNGEGVFKNFYFEKGITYNVCVFYSITPSPTAGHGVGLLTMAAANSLTAYTGTLCQSPPPNGTNVVGIGTTPASLTYNSYTFTPTANYTQFLMYVWSQSTYTSYTGVVSGLFITVDPVCATPSVQSVSSNSPNTASVTWTAVTGVTVYAVKFTNTTTGATTTGYYSLTPITAVPTGPFPTTYSSTFDVAAGTYTVTVQANIDYACTGNQSPWSAPSNPVVINN